jgi:hypothetical protein
MNITIRISRHLDSEIRNDLIRPHQFAFERIGFVSGVHSKLEKDEYLIILKKYYPIDEVDYIKDHSVGARINGNAIRKIMQHILDNHEGMFHIHMHPFNVPPGMSRTDSREIPPVLESLRNVDKSVMNGCIILSNTLYIAHIDVPDQKQLIVTKNIRVVGFSFSINI